MNYCFPTINNINDVLPYVKDREEFVIAERNFGTVINYAVAMQDTFNMTGPDDLGGAIRRECRGIIFDKEGNIMSRPFHKFFNINEREETQIHVIDMSRPHVIMEKMDGSMIRPILVDGCLRLATKMGVTEVAMQAEAWLAKQNPKLKEWMQDCVAHRITPLFEWISPSNQIVLQYNKADLVYLGSRINVTGDYYKATTTPFTSVPCYGTVKGNIADYIARQRTKEGREGDIIRFDNGHMLKVKNDWYVRIHKAIDRILFDRNVIALILNEEVDDVVPTLPKAQVERIRDIEERFWKAFKAKEEYLLAINDTAKQLYGSDRKAIATQFISSMEDKTSGPFIFRMIDGHTIRDLLLQHVEKHLTTNTKWGSCAKWLGMQNEAVPNEI